MTEFTDLYKKLSNTELFKIISEVDKYNPIAVETAKTEIDSRQLSEQELNRVEAIITERVKIKKQGVEKREQRKNKIKKGTSTLIEAISPVKNSFQTPEKIIRFTTIIFGILSIYRLYQQFGMFQFMFTDNEGEWDLSMVEYFFPIIILPIAVFLFWKRKKSGWVFFSIFLTYTSISTFAILIMSLKRQAIEIGSLTTLFPPVSPMAYIPSILFYGSYIYIISRSDVRKIFKISNKLMIITISLTAIINLIFRYLLVR